MFKVVLNEEDTLYENLVEKVEETVEHPIVNGIIENTSNLLKTKREHILRRLT